MLHYLLQVVVFQFIGLLIYDLFLKKETFFNYNRLFLLVTPLLSIILPFIKVDAIKTVIAKDFVIVLPEVIIGETVEKSLAIAPEVAKQAGLYSESTPTATWILILCLGMIVALCFFCFKALKLWRLISNNQKRWKADVLIITLPNSTSAFSFFHYVFLGDLLKPLDKSAIMEHEMVHIHQKHSLDLLFFELLRIVFWFNPLVYLYHHRMSDLHEYIADANVVKQTSRGDYYNKLLTQVFETRQFSFVNPFFKKSLIKKRIHMLNTSKSKQIKLFKYVLLLPMVFAMLVYTSSYAQESAAQIDLSQYSYSMSLESYNMSEETKKIHDAYEAFLKSNHDYVSWTKFDKESKRVYYSVHSKNEELPKGYSKHTLRFEDGSYYVSYMNLNTTNVIINDELVIQEIDENDQSLTEVPFAVVGEPPVYTSCENLENMEARKQCTVDNVGRFVNTNFNTKVSKGLGLQGKLRINVMFKIDKEGKVTGVKARAPHPKLEEEAIRVISMLPDFIPGKHKGEPIIVPYSLPILFQIDENTNSKPKN